MQNRSQEQIQKKIAKLVSNFCELKFKKKKFVPGKTTIHSSGRVIDVSEINNLVNASLDGWLTAGSHNKKFQDKLSKFLNINNVLTVNSGSSANLVALSSLTSNIHKDKSIKPGDEVITIAAGFPTTVNPIFQNGAVPVFVDIKIPTYNINEELVEAAITNKTKAIMVAHTLGNPFNLDKILSICKKYDLWLIEDNCDALGSKYKNKLTGTYGDLGTLSFYPAHHITMGEGGAVITNSFRLKRICDSFRDWGRDCYCEPGKENTCKKRFGWKLGQLPFGYDHKYIFSNIGYNMKITDMQASCGLAQLDKLKKFISKRKKNFNFLKKNLKEMEDNLIFPQAETGSDPAWFGFPISLRQNCNISRNEIIRKLYEKKIDTRLVFAGNLTKQPAYINKPFRISGELINTDFVMNNTFWVGIYPGLGEEELNFVAKNIKNCFKK